MSNRPKPRRSHRPTPTPGPGEGYGGVPCIVPDRTVPGARERAQKLSHDALIDLWGPKLKSGIWWTERAGAAGAKLYVELCESVGQQVEPEAHEIFDDNPRVLVVVAWAITEEGQAPRNPRKGWV